MSFYCSTYNPTDLGQFQTRQNVYFPAEVGKHYVISTYHGIAGSGTAYNITGATVDWERSGSASSDYVHWSTLLVTATATQVAVWFKNAANYGDMWVCRID